MEIIDIHFPSRSQKYRRNNTSPALQVILISLQSPSSRPRAAYRWFHSALAATSGNEVTFPAMQSSEKLLKYSMPFWGSSTRSDCHPHWW